MNHSSFERLNKLDIRKSELSKHLYDLRKSLNDLCLNSNSSYTDFYFKSKGIVSEIKETEEILNELTRITNMNF